MRSFLGMFVASNPLIYDLHVRERIPNALMDQTRIRASGSVHASSILAHDDDRSLRQWISVNLVDPVQWACPHPHDVPANASNSFRSYEGQFVDRGFSVRNVQNDQRARGYLNVHYDHAEPHQRVLLAGRADYIISTGGANEANYLFQAVGVVEIQSSDDEEICEMQMMLYLLIFMNTRGLRRLHGFLVYRNGTCRVYKASRAGGNIIYEQDDTFHIFYMVPVLEYLLTLA